MEGTTSADIRVFDRVIRRGIAANTVAEQPDRALTRPQVLFGGPEVIETLFTFQRRKRVLKGSFTVAR